MRRYRPLAGVLLLAVLSGCSARETAPPQVSLVLRYEGEGFSLSLPESGWNQTEIPEEMTGKHWYRAARWESASETGSALTVDYFATTVEDQSTVCQEQGYTQVADQTSVWERQEEGTNRRYYLYAAPEGCWRVATEWTSDLPEDTGEAAALERIAESFLGK